MSADAPFKLSPWAAIVGPCYTASSFCRETGYSADQLQHAGDELSVLRLQTADGAYLFPAFQLVDGAPLPGLSRVLHALRSGIDDPWTWAQWLRGREPGQELDGVERLRAGNVEVLEREARHDAAAWRA